jgi:hypothetical protein
MSSTQAKTITPPTNTSNSSTVGMFIVGGMLLASAGFTLYTRRTESMLRQMNHVVEMQAKRVPPRKPGPMTKEEWDKVRPRVDKDDFF